MLLFIALFAEGLLSENYSNTSHVIVYPVPHSVFLRVSAFKYISCYCLSILLIIVVVLKLYSNTSHVIVYLFEQLMAPALTEFKYISCYCLSGRTCEIESFKKIQIHLMLLFISSGDSAQIGSTFKYISCYCLSSGLNEYIASCRNSNTSHVIVYQKANGFLEKQKNPFKYISCYCLS